MAEWRVAAIVGKARGRNDVLERLTQPSRVLERQRRITAVLAGYLAIAATGRSHRC